MTFFVHMHLHFSFLFYCNITLDARHYEHMILPTVANLIWYSLHVPKVKLIAMKPQMLSKHFLSAFLN